MIKRKNFVLFYFLEFESDVAESEKEKIKFISKLQEELCEEQNLFF